MLANHQQVSEPNSNNKLRDGLRPYQEFQALKAVLGAMYNERPTLWAQPRLLDIARIADFYCALPVVSSALWESLWDADRFGSKIANQAIEDHMELLKVAKRLRHPILFREAFIYVVSMWHESDIDWRCTQRQEDSTLVGLIEVAQARICIKIARVSCSLFSALPRNPEIHDAVLLRYDPITEEEDPMWMAGFFKIIAKHLVSLGYVEGADFLEDRLEELLTDKLALGKSFAEAGVGEFSERLLCADISDKALPWDRTQKDW